MTIKNAQMNKTELRNFGITTGTIFVLLFGLFFPWLLESNTPYWPFVVAGIFFLWAFIHAQSLGPVYSIWMKIGHVLGWINTRIILGILFYGVFMPIGALIRVFGIDLLKRKTDSSKSYRVESATPDKDHIERPY